uniref:Putative odorant receptor 10 n=1 Tax=Conopomorpha sinensis TaxID=940481 RepID=A0A3S7SGQ0_9NEOP|nr:putative odorant receptor 10 [Conopomorpha sinensis]
MTENCKLLSKQESITFSKAFDRLFVKSLLHYEDINRLASGTLDVFGDAILFQFLVTGWIICTTAYKAINMDPASVEFFSMIFYMSCILVQIFLYCFYGNEITYESMKIMESVYEMNWLDISPSQRRALIIFMERVKRPIEPKAGHLIPLTASTFITIIKSSYTFYTVLKTTD